MVRSLLFTTETIPIKPKSPPSQQSGSAPTFLEGYTDDEDDDGDSCSVVQHLMCLVLLNLHSHTSPFNGWKN